ncbi:hypothetical protein KZZ52_28265 [Dactylosporangium sp. AC04546]|uniref:hypothetical protein n=1 Tax=Dactylosporangium sp. AC04546 TaxID=2862460 RepID=UPI001EE04D22|nr:hypothetical protein [Dactylosporangium sp. AC04546]WVK89164.1 hypothetical protein KZZ52_28265 [Dactylosporangium sp. AC04546]
MEFDYGAPAAIRAARDAIRAEAARWDDAAERMRATKTAVAGLGLSPLGFAVADVADTGQWRVYEEMRAHLGTLCGAAAAEFHAIAAVLRACADRYTAADLDAVTDLAAVWGD